MPKEIKAPSYDIDKEIELKKLELEILKLQLKIAEMNKTSFTFSTASKDNSLPIYNHTQTINPI